MTSDGPRELGSWKEIAGRLGVSVRTAQKWEQERGLPVRRVPGGRGRVFIGTEDLDLWRNSASFAPEPPAGRRTIRRLAWIGAAGLGLGILAALFGAPWHTAGRPFSSRVEANSLVVCDDRGKELWRHVFEPPLHQGTYDPNPMGYRQTWSGDLDGDGSVETLFAYYPAQIEAAALICFSERGEEKWRFRPGRTVSTRLETFAPPFHVVNFEVARWGRSRRMSVVVSACQHLYYPDQVVLLSGTGKVVREYWHSGALRVYAADVDGDGTIEICLAGTNNGYRMATLIVLDPGSFGGASVEENKDYQLQGFAPGVERARLLFPRSCINRKFEPRNSAERLLAQPGAVTVEVFERSAPAAVCFFHLDRNLGVREFVPADSFLRLHSELTASETLDHEFSAAEAAELGKVVVLKR